MIRTQIQFPDPLFERIKRVAELKDWPVAEVIRRATELYLQRYALDGNTESDWHFPTIDSGGDYKTDPAKVHAEADAVLSRTTS